MMLSTVVPLKQHDQTPGDLELRFFRLKSNFYALPTEIFRVMSSDIPGAPRFSDRQLGLYAVAVARMILDRNKKDQTSEDTSSKAPLPEEALKAALNLIRLRENVLDDQTVLASRINAAVEALDAKLTVLRKNKRFTQPLGSVDALELVRTACPVDGSGRDAATALEAICTEKNQTNKVAQQFSHERKQLLLRLTREKFDLPDSTINTEWKSETVCALTAGIEAERAYDRLPILADALEEAGCDDGEVLVSLRSPEPAYRGYWVTALIGGYHGREYNLVDDRQQRSLSDWEGLRLPPRLQQ